MFRTRMWVPLCALLAVLSVQGCDEDTKTVFEAEPKGTVAFHFDHHVDGTPLEFNQMIFTNSSGTDYSVSKLRYVVSDVVLHRTNGEVFGMDGIHYRDHSDADTRSFTLGNVPKGTYDMVSFTFGLDESKNVTNKYLNSHPDFHTALAWPGPLGASQGVGYHYMQLEGNFRVDPDSTAGYTTHTGARWCDGACGPAGMVFDETPNHHFFRVYLPIDDIAIDGDDWDVTIRMDINGWYHDATPTDTFDSEYDWHDLAVQLIMANLGAQKKLMVNGPYCFDAVAAATN